jgi:hypothetical protein
MTILLGPSARGSRACLFLGLTVSLPSALTSCGGPVNAASQDPGLPCGPAMTSAAVQEDLNACSLADFVPARRYCLDGPDWQRTGEEGIKVRGMRRGLSLGLALLTGCVGSGGGGNTSSGDTTPPQVQITEPTGSSSLSGSTAIVATASDDVAVVSVQFQLDGADFGPPIQQAPWRMAWDTTSVADGIHVLTALALDGAQNEGDSAPVSVDVSNASTGDTTPPQVAITAPGGSSTLSGATVITASASDNVAVVSVQIRLDGADLGPPIVQPPWRMDWDTTTVSDGPHVLLAVALDAAQNAGVSPPVTFDVSNTPPAPALEFSTFFGDQGLDTARDVFVDRSGFVYVVGGTDSPNFPTTPGAYDRTFNGVNDAFVAKFAPNGALVFSTLLGGPNYDRAYAIEVDAQDVITVAGRCGDGFPTTPGALQRTFGGDTNPNSLYGPQDGFVTRISPDGSSLVWSTYFGGNGPDSPRDMDLDGAGNVYVVAGVLGPDPYVTAGSFDTTFSGPTDGLVAEISADGSHLVWGSYFGGSGPDGGTPSIRVATDGTAWVLSGTQSADFPVTSGAYQRVLGGGIDLVLLKIAPGGGSLLYATFLGGSGTEFTETHGLWVDANGEAVVAATTTSTDLPFVAASIPPSFQPAYGGTGGTGTGANTNYPGDGFVARISADGSQLLAFTYLGGSAGEGIEGVAVDGMGSVIVTGATYSPNFPVTADAFQRLKSGLADTFVARLSPDLSTLEFGTFFGGSGEDFGRSLAVGAGGRAVCVGMTASANYPTTPGAYEPIYGGGADDAFLVTIDF